MLDILPARDKETVQAWIEARPEIRVITRDRSRSYQAAITAASSSIKQVGDRWHILRLLSEAVYQAVKTVVPAKWFPEASDEGPPGPLPKRLQSIQKREEALWDRIQEVQRLRKEGQSITAIADRMHLSRNTVYKDLGVSSRPSLSRGPIYASYLPLIRRLIAEGRKAEEIEGVCREAGFDGHQKTLFYLITDERRERKRAGPLRLHKLLLQKIWEDPLPHPEEAFRTLHPELPEMFPEVLEIQEFLQSFRKLFQEKASDGLRHWLRDHPSSSIAPLQTFIRGVREDLQAVYYAVVSPWSNGLLEGTVNKLKTIKRIMYGRGHLDILFRRMQFQAS